MKDDQIPREAETLLEYLGRVREAYRVVRQFEEWRASVPSIPGVPDGPLVPPTAGKGSAEKYRGARLGEAVLSVLEEHPSQAYRAKEIMIMLTDGGMTFTANRPDLSISRCLSKAMKDGRVVKRGRGLWQWKPANPIEAMNCGMCSRHTFGEMVEEGVWRIHCDGCGQYRITSQALAIIEDEMSREALTGVRDKVRSLAEEGKEPLVTTKSLKEWASSGKPPRPPLISQPDDDLPF